MIFERVVQVHSDIEYDEPVFLWFCPVESPQAKTPGDNDWSGHHYHQQPLQERTHTKGKEHWA